VDEPGKDGGELKEPIRGLRIGNLGEPIRLTDVKIDGVSGSAAKEGENVHLITEMSVNSDDPFFHRIVENIAKVIHHRATQDGNAVSIDRHRSPRNKT
jgi:hypothetical protein